MELADGVDVRGVEGVADDGQALRRVQGDAFGAAIDPLQLEDFSGGGHPGDEAGLVFTERIAVDVRDNVDVGLFIMDRTLWSVEP